MLDAALAGEAPIVLTTEDRTVIAISPREHRANIRSLLDQYGIGEPKRVHGQSEQGGA